MIEIRNRDYDTILGLAILSHNSVLILLVVIDFCILCFFVTTMCVHDIINIIYLFCNNMSIYIFIETFSKEIWRERYEECFF